MRSHLHFRQAGISLIELVMFIVIVSVGIAGILSVINVSTRHSADPMVRKQAIAVAEALLEEIEAQPFTYCDPDDANAATATSATMGAGGCASLVQGLTKNAGEIRSDSANPFDNVGDYGAYEMTGISDVTGTSIAGLNNYTARVTLTDETIANVNAGDALRIDVRVFNLSQNVDVTLTGYRLRYAPNTTP